MSVTVSITSLIFLHHTTPHTIFRVLSQRKANVLDPTETPQLLAKLGANAILGEISLLTQEPRTATVTVTSPTARVFLMTKEKFDSVMQVVNAHLFCDKKEIGREVVNKVPIFQSLSSSKKKAILDAMRPMNFLPNTYICRQGSSGNTFYIIADGSCRVTVNTGKGAEKEVTRLGAGDFFGKEVNNYGELLLLDSMCAG